MQNQFIQNTSDLANWIGTQYPEIKGQKATAIVRTLFGCISKSLFDQQTAGVENPHVQLHGFGNVKLVRMKARRARNPKTGAPVQVGERLKLKWNASNNLKEAFNSNDVEFFNQFTTLSAVDSTNGTTNGESASNESQGDMFSGGKNTRNSTSQGAGNTPDIREMASVGGASEARPAKRPRGRPKKTFTAPVEASAGGASTSTPAKRTRARRTPKAETSGTRTPSTKPTSSTNGTTVADARKLRAAFDQFLKTLS